MDVYSVRLPEAAIKELKKLAAAQYLPPRAVARAWILQRLEVEQNEKPAVGDEVSNRALTAGGHQTSVGADANESES